MKVSLSLLGFSWYGLKVVGLEVDLTGCEFLSSSCLSNSGCLGLSGLNLTEGQCRGVGLGLSSIGSQVGSGEEGGLVHGAGEGLGAGIGLGGGGL